MASRACVGSTATTLVSLLQDEPPALLVAEFKFGHGSCFGRLLVRRFNGPEILPALFDDRDALASQLGGGGLLSRVHRGLPSAKGAVRA
jgi:hypothetical protein